MKNFGAIVAAIDPIITHTPCTDSWFPWHNTSILGIPSNIYKWKSSLYPFFPPPSTRRVKNRLLRCTALIRGCHPSVYGLQSFKVCTAYPTLLMLRSVNLGRCPRLCYFAHLGQRHTPLYCSSYTILLLWRSFITTTRGNAPGWTPKQIQKPWRGEIK